MANTLTDVIPSIVTQGLMALRQMVTMPRLINTNYSSDAASKGDTITVPKPASITTVAVSPSNTAPATADITPENATIALDKWYEAPFYLTDKDLKDAFNGITPMQVTSAIASLTEQVNGDCMSLYKDVYGFAGAAATTPFASNYSEASAVRKVLNEQKAFMSDRRLVIDPDAEENAINLSSFASADAAGSASVIMDGQIGRKLGFDWYMDQQVPTHTTGGGSGWLVNSASVAVGDSTVAIDTGSGDPVAGDVFTVAGDTQTYVVESYSSNTITFSPKAKVAWANNAAITFKASHVSNLAFHRDAFAIASRPLADTEGLGNLIQSVVDPVTGLSLRLEVSREHKRTRWSFDILYGVGTLRPELAARLAG